MLNRFIFSLKVSFLLPCPRFFFCVRFRLFIAWNIHISIFSSDFSFLFILLIIRFPVLFLAAISLSLLFFMESSNPCIDASTLFSMLTSPLPPSFHGTLVCQRHLCDVRSYASSLVFVFSGSFSCVLPSSIFRMVLSILQWGDYPNVYHYNEIHAIEFGFEKFSRSSEILFSIFSFVWCPLPISPSTYKFPFFRAFSFYLDLAILFLSLSVFFHFWL